MLSMMLNGVGLMGDETSRGLHPKQPWRLVRNRIMDADGATIIENPAPYSFSGEVPILKLWAEYLEAGGAPDIKYDVGVLTDAFLKAIMENPFGALPLIFYFTPQKWCPHYMGRVIHKVPKGGWTLKLAPSLPHGPYYNYGWTPQAPIIAKAKRPNI